MSRMRNAAIRYAEHGWLIFPCGVRRKLPMIPEDEGGRGFKDATTNLEKVDAWFTRWPNANIGLWPGPSGLLVIDVDGELGRASAEALDLLPRDTLAVNTPRGVHLYYRRPTPEAIPNIKLPGIDIRCDNGYVIAPPSVHPDGGRYTWAHGDLPIRSLPDAAYAAVMDAIRPKERPRSDGAARPRVTRRYVVTAMERELETLRSTPEGGRNDALNRAAFSLARFVPTGDVRSAELYDLLFDIGLSIGLTDRETRSTLKSAFRSRDIGVPV